MKFNVLTVTEPSLLVSARQIQKIIANLWDKEIILSRVQAGDLMLKLDPTVPEQMGLIRFDQTLTIMASSVQAVLSTCTYALIRLYFDQLDSGETSVSYIQPQRIFMLDMGRKYFSKQSVLKLIDLMGLAQFNYLQLHFSENEGFRIESEVAPEAVSQEFLTKAEIREIILYATTVGIEIIPDLDSPGHLQQLLASYPQWQLQVKNEHGDLIADPKALNISSEAAVQFILDLYKEYATLFSTSTYFHIGGDEFVDFDKIDDYPDLTAYAKAHFGEKAEAIDTYVAFVNRVIAQMNQGGFIPRVWNDGFFRLDRKEVVSLSHEVEITYWTKWHQMMAPVQTFIDKGYQVINFNDNYFYYVLGENAGYTYPTYEKIGQEWTPDMFAQKQVLEIDTAKIPGIAFSVWSDRPEAQTQNEVVTNVGLDLLAIMQKMTGGLFLSEEQAQQLIGKM